MTKNAKANEASVSEELVVQDEKDQEDEADDDAYGNQFLLFGPVAKNVSVGMDRASQH